MNRLGKRIRRLAIESLDKREMMAADVAVSVVGGVMSIVGTAGNDTVTVDALPDGTTRVNSGRGLAGDPLRTVYRGATSAYSSINAQLLAGYDKLTVTMTGKTLVSMNVGFGTGTAEELFVRSARIGRLNVDAGAAIGGRVYVRDSVVDSLMADYGADTGNDLCELTRSTIGYLQAQMGSGNDALILYTSTIRNANVALGDGRDNVSAPPGSSAILAGVVNGGTGIDRVARGTVGGASLLGFELTV